MSPSDEIVQTLQEQFQQCQVHRPMRLERYEQGQVLRYRVRGVLPAVEADVTLQVERFVGGGFAGQVYRVKVLEIDPAPSEAPSEAPGEAPGEASGQASDKNVADASLGALTVGGVYAMKILIPPAAGSVRFRNLIYFLGFQGPFSLQCNTAAARAGALWQKFIRRAAAVEFGDERCVVDIHATFVDERMGSCGELSEWIAGRNWHFEVDDHLDRRSRWQVDEPLELEGVGAPEFRAKRQFMADMVRLFHRVGAPELARQYEWWTCKSQPNCLKRLDAGDGPADGLTAVDFRAGLALLCWLPMSPGDLLLIGRGLAQRGALVQFDRGKVKTLRAYLAAHPGRFDDMTEAVEELARCEDVYRNSLIDLTHNHLRLLVSPRLWRGIFAAAVESWRIRRMADADVAERLDRSKLLCLAFALCGLLSGLGSTLKAAGVLGLLAAGVMKLFTDLAWTGPLALGSLAALVAGLAAACVGRSARTLWGRADLRRHYLGMLGDRAYLRRALRAHACESLTAWVRAGRIASDRAEGLLGSVRLWLVHAPLSVLPVWLHRGLTDPAHAWRCMAAFCMRPLRLYFNAAAREQWMLEMLEDGRRKGMVTPDEAELIEKQLSEPFIQKYLKSLAVHVCTLPVTQVVSVAVALFMWDGALTLAENLARSGVILGVFQIIPLSPGSLVRGLYVTWMALKDRSYEKYNVALWLGYWKYIGYLSFPIQMARTYPEIARFMAGRWATGAVHVIPVFGEHGALAEHAVFDLFYNRPLTIRRKMALRAAAREGEAPRHLQVLPAAALATLVALLPGLVAAARGAGAAFEANNWLLAAGAFIGGKLTARMAGGASFARRLVLGLGCGVLAATLVTAGRVIAADDPAWETVKHAFLPGFGAAMAALIGALLDELRMGDSPKPPEPQVEPLR